MADHIFGVGPHRLRLVYLVQSVKNIFFVGVWVPMKALLNPIHNLVDAGELFLL